jgi:hypothetical protein
VNKEGFVREEKLSFVIDSKAPKIYSTSPKLNAFTDGSDFYVKFIEDNTKMVTLRINKTLVYNITDCDKNGKYTECYANIDMDLFEGKEVEYFFIVNDSIRGTSSKPVKVKVDSINPALEIISPENNENYSKRVLFTIKVNESNLKSLYYVYESGGIERSFGLCSKLKDSTCNLTKSFAPGNYSLTIYAEDKVGNLVGESVEFKVK